MFNFLILAGSVVGVLLICLFVIIALGWEYPLILLGVVLAFALLFFLLRPKPMRDSLDEGPARPGAFHTPPGGRPYKPGRAE